MRKIAKKSEKREKKRKIRLEIRFALFRLEAKITQVKQSEKLKAKKDSWRGIYLAIDCTVGWLSLATIPLKIS
jgi:hypothetical protein